MPTILSRRDLLDQVEGPTQLSHYLSELPLIERSSCIVALLRQAIKSPIKKSLLMSLPEPILLDIMEETLAVRSHHPISRQLTECPPTLLDIDPRKSKALPFLCDRSRAKRSPPSKTSYCAFKKRRGGSPILPDQWCQITRYSSH